MTSGQAKGFWRFAVEQFLTNEVQPYSIRLSLCTLRARAAFVLVLAEVASAAIETRRGMAAHISASIDLAWRWQETCHVSGEELYDAVVGKEIDDEYSLAGALCFVTAIQEPAWTTVTGALLYIAWQAYVVAGEEVRPEPICDVSDEDIDLTVDAAREMLNFNQAAVDRVAAYCTCHHKAANDKELGEPISRETMMQVANWASV